jgi:alpha-L-fucosidase 2
MKNALYAIIILALFFCKTGHTQSPNTLWYDKAATYFEESIPLGNGNIGAAVFGGVTSDKIYLNHATLWSGEPVNPDMNPDAYKNIPAIRNALKNENYPLADSLNRKLQGSFSESFAPLGTLWLKFEHPGAVADYHRELDISNAISSVSYKIDNVQFTREYFISHPDQVMVLRLTCSREHALDFTIGFESLLKYRITGEKEGIKVAGYAPYHTEPNYRGNLPNAVLFDEHRGTRFAALIDVQYTEGSLVVTDSTISLSGCSEAVILVAMATSFNGYDRDPATEGLDEEALARGILAKASLKTFDELKKSHITDYQHFFDRVKLNLGRSDAPDLPTDERLKRYTQGKEDKNLEVLYFQFGRYLLISSSRTAGVPANLQGIWNPYLRPPWSSNYTLNINAEENYWLAENANLSEMHEPLMGFIKNIAATGETTARTFYGAGGWAACHNSDIWAMSNPVGDFGSGDPVWANWNMGGTWLSTHLWEHYIFTQDLEFLENDAYPLMAGAARFCLDWLVEDQSGKLITSPSTSPENRYITPQGYRGATFYGGTADLAMIRELFTQTVSASIILDEEPEFRARLVDASERLLPYRIGKNGNLQEWYYDWEDEDPRHRHQSHLFGLYPGHQITPLSTPELAMACRNTLEIKGDETTGWSKGWRINLWARLWDGNRAYKLFRELLNYVEPDGVRTSYSRGGGTYPNLFDAHPPFQIDGNFGGTAAVVEMLVQSTADEIRMLPALPDEWERGSIEGVCARGGFVLSLEWSEMELKKVVVTSRKGGRTTLICGRKQQSVELGEGETIALDW